MENENLDKACFRLFRDKVVKERDFWKEGRAGIVKANFKNKEIFTKKILDDFLVENGDLIYANIIFKNDSSIEAIHNYSTDKIKKTIRFIHFE